MDFDAVLGEVSPVVNRMGRTLPCGKNSSPVMARQDYAVDGEFRCFVQLLD